MSFLSVYGSMNKTDMGLVWYFSHLWRHILQLSNWQVCVKCLHNQQQNLYFGKLWSLQADHFYWLNPWNHKQKYIPGLFGKLFFDQLNVLWNPSEFICSSATLNSVKLEFSRDFFGSCNWIFLSRGLHPHCRIDCLLSMFCTDFKSTKTHVSHELELNIEWDPDVCKKKVSFVQHSLMHLRELHFCLPNKSDGMFSNVHMSLWLEFKQGQRCCPKPTGSNITSRSGEERWSADQNVSQVTTTTI